MFHRVCPERSGYGRQRKALAQDALLCGKQLEALMRHRSFTLGAVFT